MKQTLKNVLIIGGLALVLAACGAGSSTSGTSNDTSSNASTGNNATAQAGTSATAAADNSATTQAGTSGTGQAGARRGQGIPGVAGQVVSVNGNTITVQNQRQQGTFTVNLSDSTQIFKPTTVDLSKIQPGETIIAVGSRNGDVLTATQIRIGMAGGGFGGFGGGRQGAGNGANGGQAPTDATAQAGGNGANGGQAPANGTAQAGRGLGRAVFGTVDQVSGNTITVKTMSGTTTQVQLASNGQVLQQVAATAADITAGEQIVAVGTRNGTTVTATRIDIVPAMMMQQPTPQQ